MTRAQSEAYAEMARLTWRAIDARQAHGRESTEYQEAHSLAQRQKQHYLKLRSKKQ